MANTSEEETKVYFTYSSGQPCTSTPAHVATTFPGQHMSAPVHLSTRDRDKYYSISLFSSEKKNLNHVFQCRISCFGC